MPHDCAEHFEHVGVEKDSVETLKWVGACTECGRELVEVYDYAGTYALDSGEFIRRRLPEDVEALHRVLGSFIMAAKAGENRRAAALKQRFERMLDGVIG